jgi:hypothetical protein
MQQEIQHPAQQKVLRVLKHPGLNKKAKLLRPIVQGFNKRKMKMKKLIVLSAVVLSAVGCAGYQAKLENAQAKAKDVKEKVECRAKVILPYLDYVMEVDLPAVLEGSDISDILAMSEATQDEVEKVKAAFKACGKIEIK